MGLAVDLGWDYYTQQQVQTAADAAASAAAVAAKTNTDSCSTITCGSAYACAGVSPATNSLQSGCLFAAANAPSGATVSMIENNSANLPSGLSGVSPLMWIQATVSAPTHSLFFAQSGTISASAIGGVVSTGAPATSPCIYVLNPTAANAFDAGNGVTVTTTSCGIYVNSSAKPTAMFVTGGATVNSGTIDVVGGFTKNNGGSTSSVPATGVAAVADPFGSLGVPAAPTNNGSCNYSGNYSTWVAGGYSLCPGTYNSGFLLSNGNSAVMASGIYVIKGGPFSIQSGPLTASGPVLIYLSGSQAYANIANGTSVTLSALSTGQYQGVLFYQDRSVASPQASTIAGGANMNLSGSLYFPNALVNINNGTNSQTGALVVGTVNFQGGAKFKSGTQAQTGIAPANSSIAVLLQ